MKHIRLGRPQVFNVQTGIERCYYCDTVPTHVCRRCGAHTCDEHTPIMGTPCGTHKALCHECYKKEQEEFEEKMKRVENGEPVELMEALDFVDQLLEDYVNDVDDLDKGQWAMERIRFNLGILKDEQACQVKNVPQKRPRTPQKRRARAGRIQNTPRTEEST